MNGRIRIGIAAVAAASALLLTACGGGGDDGSDDEIEGLEENTDAGGEESEEPSPSATEDDGIDRPEIELPDDVNNVFEEVDTDDPVELAVLADHERRVNSIDEAITSGDMNRPALGFYSTRGMPFSPPWSGSSHWPSPTLQLEGHRPVTTTAGDPSNDTRRRSRSASTPDGRFEGIAPGERGAPHEGGDEDARGTSSTTPGWS